MQSISFEWVDKKNAEKIKNKLHRLINIFSVICFGLLLGATNAAGTSAVSDSDTIVRKAMSKEVKINRGPYFGLNTSLGLNEFYIKTASTLDLPDIIARSKCPDGTNIGYCWNLKGLFGVQLTRFIAIDVQCGWDLFRDVVLLDYKSSTSYTFKSSEVEYFSANDKLNLKISGICIEWASVLTLYDLVNMNYVIDAIKARFGFGMLFCDSKSGLFYCEHYWPSEAEIYRGGIDNPEKYREKIILSPKSIPLFFIGLERQGNNGVTGGSFGLDFRFYTPNLLSRESVNVRFINQTKSLSLPDVIFSVSVWMEFLLYGVSR